MPDINNFGNDDNTIRQIGEKIEDNTKLIEEAFFDSPPVKFLSDGDTSLIAPIHSRELLDQAHAALKHGDMKEAAHELRREVNFCNMIPKMAGSPYEKTGQAGMKALEEHKSTAAIDQEMNKAWEDAWEKDPAPFYKISE